MFTPLLSKHVTRWHEFHLRKKDGRLERQRSSFADLLLAYEEGRRTGGLAQSWARQGIPMTAYAKEIRMRYEQMVRLPSTAGSYLTTHDGSK